MWKCLREDAAPQMLKALMKDDVRGWQEAIELLKQAFDSDYQNFTYNVDFVLQWACWRMITNWQPTTTDMFLSFFQWAVGALSKKDYQLQDREADAFLPFIIHHILGSNKQSFIEKGKQIIQQAEMIYEVGGLIYYLYQTLKETKNNRVRTISLEIMNNFICDKTLQVVDRKMRPRMATLLIQTLDKADNNVRPQALKVLAHFHVGIGPERMKRMYDKATPKVKGMIERYMKDPNNLPKAPDAPTITVVRSSSPKPIRQNSQRGGPPSVASAPPVLIPRQNSVQERLRMRLTNISAGFGSASNPIAARAALNYRQSLMAKSPPGGQRAGAPDDPFDLTWIDRLKSGGLQSNFPASSAPQVSQGRPPSTTGYDQFANYQRNFQSQASAYGNTYGQPGRHPEHASIAASALTTGTNMTTNTEHKLMTRPSAFTSQNAALVGGTTGEPDAAPKLPSLVDGMKNSNRRSLDTFVKMLQAGDLQTNILSSHTDSVINALVAWLENITSSAPSLVMTSGEDVSRTAESILQALKYISKDKKLLRVLMFETLQRYIKCLLCTLISQNLRKNFRNRKKLIYSLNEITLQVLQNCSRTNSFFILLTFLKSAQPYPPTNISDTERSAQFANLVVKCLAKLLVLMPKIIGELKVSVLLPVIHQFLSARNPNDWTKSGANDKPFRCVKTCLSQLVQCIGPDIRKELSGFEVSAHIHTYAEEFLRKRFPNSVTDPTEAPAGAPANPDDPEAKRKHEIHLKLTSIFSDLTRKETTAKAMQDLFEFLETNPGEDLQPYLKDTSAVFQGYIKRGLERQKKLRRACEPKSAPPAKSKEQKRAKKDPPQRRRQSALSTVSSATTDALRQRLASLRSPSSTVTAPATSIDAIRARLARPPVQAAGTSSVSGSQTLEQLRARLSQLKNASQRRN